MPDIRYTSTINVKPQSVNATNLVPIFVSTSLYSGYADLSDVNYWGTFKWGTRKWGPTTKYSVGQPMPQISTVEI